jgi:hypothetical protein
VHFKPTSSARGQSPELAANRQTITYGGLARRMGYTNAKGGGAAALAPALLGGARATVSRERLHRAPFVLAHEA